MPYRTDIAYLYDGSFYGLLCCVYESYYAREMPFAIFNYDEEQETLFVVKEIFTDEVKAEKVEKSIAEKISSDALKLVHMCYLSRIDERELAILRFLRMGYKIGADVMDMLANDVVRVVVNAAKNVAGESHLFTGFLRFGEYNGALAAVIEPKNFILPVIAPHFCDRLPSEQFLIYDKTHKYVFVYEKGEHNLMPLDNFELPEAGEDEEMYRRLWKRFYTTIAIKGRINPKLQRGNLPKRYRKHMTEFVD
ncbi:MAG: TIGR03915 family putative DNA repair protein [Defluviitaleaceae bacterium]|nr:TIGR03915 family putative DNA repair protein [Defluviitaleaceae bacterium]